MATFKQYKKKNGDKMWMFQAYKGLDPLTGKQKNITRRGFKTQKEAKIAAAQIELNIVEEVPVQYTYKEVYDLWFEEYQSTVKPSTLLKTERLFKNHVIHRFGDKLINEITPLYCQTIMNEWHEEFKRASMMMNYVGLVFDYAIRMQIIQLNPTKVIKKPLRIKEVKEDKDLNFYDKDELVIFMSALEKGINFRALVYFRLLAFTGIRKGESLALKWSDVNFDNKTLNINKAVSRKDTGLFIQTPKTPSSIRRISLDDKTLSLLSEFKENTDDDQLIFHSDSLNILSPAKPRKWYLTAYNRIGDDSFKQISIHGFRHTHASLLFEAGASLKDVQARLGHSDIQTTMDVYTHITKDAKEKLAEKFNSFVDF